MDSQTETELTAIKQMEVGARVEFATARPGPTGPVMAVHRKARRNYVFVDPDGLPKGAVRTAGWAAHHLFGREQPADG